MLYEPKTGRNVWPKNHKNIRKYLKDNPGCTGVEIARALGLSLVTVYKHLAVIREKDSA